MIDCEFCKVRKRDVLAMGVFCAGGAGIYILIWELALREFVLGLIG